MDNRIDKDELGELFGGRIPMKAVDLLFNSDSSLTVGQIRDQLRVMAKEWRSSERNIEVTVGFIARSDDAITEDDLQQFAAAVKSNFDSLLRYPVGNINLNSEIAVTAAFKQG